jgi:beta-N-acetylhexosaminidase
MYIEKIKTSLVYLFSITCVVVTGLLIYFSQLSLTAGFRFYALYGWGCFLIVLIILNQRFFSKQIPTWILSFLVLVISINLLSFEYNKFSFYNHSLNTENHVVLGFRNDSEILNLVKQNKVAGVYFTQRNVKGKTKQEIKSFIKELQTERLKHSDQELLIAVDQEGGIVSHLSPLLTLTESLGQASDQNRIKEIAAIHGKELSELGFNVNFSPVADLQNYAKSSDGFSQIASRSISNNPGEVIQDVSQYCKELSKYEVRCTLKHFPGIGEVQQDTHFELGIIYKSKDELTPQSSTFQDPGTMHLVMLSHTLVTDIDDQNPVSTSKAGIDYLKSINPKAITITDDISMLPISRGIGIKKAYQQSVAAGVDYILISYDKELIYRLYE